MEKLLIKIPVSLGELVDKITILRIKKSCMTDPAKIANVSNEYDMLVAIPEYLAVKNTIADKEHELLRVNQRLWWYEEDIREFNKRETQNAAETLSVAKGIHIANDKRSQIKKEINIMCNSELIEEKSYE